MGTGRKKGGPKVPTSRAALATIGHRRARIPRRVAPRQSPPLFPDAHSGYPEPMPTSTPLTDPDLLVVRHALSRDELSPEAA